MKNILRLVLIVFCFTVFAALGFGLADWNSSGSAQSTTSAPVTSEPKQHNFILVHVDQMDGAQPRLISVWFLSYLLMEQSRPRIVMAQIYPSDAGNNLQAAFSLNDQGEPVDAFWRQMRALNVVKWDGYLMMDNLTVQRILEWTQGPGNYTSAFADTMQDIHLEKTLLQSTCDDITGIDLRERSDLHWDDLVPSHLHTDLKMDVALTYWKQITNAPGMDRCDVILTPHAAAP